jgi:hypothetical protein
MLFASAYTQSPSPVAVILRREEFPQPLGPLDLTRALLRSCSPGMTEEDWHSLRGFTATFITVTASGIARAIVFAAGGAAPRTRQAPDVIALYLPCLFLHAIQGQETHIENTARRQDADSAATRNRHPMCMPATRNHRFSRRLAANPRAARSDISLEMHARFVSSQRPWLRAGNCVVAASRARIVCRLRIRMIDTVRCLRHDVHQLRDSA